ncbi:PQQ-dependent sugar dehydrogenase [Bacterioplanoides pacificum]|uniref:PQQ-dependent sugar dehydrogenase n=1 Tax=Bacterioplanoides pacificum TaxID=1171596 RepID=A0ABV7VVV0_9GAMM
MTNMRRMLPLSLFWLLACLAGSVTADNAIRVAPGYQLQRLAEVPGARQMVLSPAGHLYVGSRQYGKVHVVRNFSRGGRQAEVILEGVSMPSGLAMDANGDLLVAAVNEIWLLAAADQRLASSTQAAQLSRHWQLLTDALPQHSHHGWKAIEVSPDQQTLVVPVGAPCNICLVFPHADEPTGTILALDLSALKAGKLQYHILAMGVRNSVGMAFHPESGELWFSDNGRDWLGDDLPACEINRVPMGWKSRPHFGFPFVHADAQGGQLPEPHAEIRRQHPGELPFIDPQIVLQAHSAPLGIHFYQGPYKALAGHLLVAEHGSWNRSTPVGYRVTAYAAATSEPGVLVDFLDGEQKLGRPVDIIEQGDGSLLISDDANGLIWHLSRASRSD